MSRIVWLAAMLVFSTSFVWSTTIPGLGTATFPTSTHSATAARDFARGLLLLHVFEYTDAAKSFVAAEKEDPGFALAYLGRSDDLQSPGLG